MTPVNHPERLDLSLWSEILYLDPDFEKQNHTWRNKTTRRKLAAGVILTAVLAGVIFLRYVHLIPNLTN